MILAETTRVNLAICGDPQKKVMKRVIWAWVGLRAPRALSSLRRLAGDLQENLRGTVLFT